jgi:hypothetical protein
MKLIKLSGGALNLAQVESTDCPLPDCAFPLGASIDRLPPS